MFINGTLVEHYQIKPLPHNTLLTHMISLFMTTSVTFANEWPTLLVGPLCDFIAPCCTHTVGCVGSVLLGNGNNLIGNMCIVLLCSFALLLNNFFLVSKAIWIRWFGLYRLCVITHSVNFHRLSLPNNFPFAERMPVHRQCCDDNLTLLLSLFPAFLIICFSSLPPFSSFSHPASLFLSSASCHSAST